MDRPGAASAIGRARCSPVEANVRSPRTKIGRVVTPRDELELNVLERTGDPEAAAFVGEAVQTILEAQADALSWVMGVPAELLMPELWNSVETS